MQITYKTEDGKILCEPNSIRVKINGDEYQLTQYLDYLKIVKIYGEKGETIQIEPQVSNSILIK